MYFHEKLVIVLLMSEHDHSDEMIEYICEDCGEIFEDSANDPHDRCPCCDRKNINFYIRHTTSED